LNHLNLNNMGPANILKSTHLRIMSGPTLSICYTYIWKFYTYK